MHYLVTGGAGFIGSHIVERLVMQGDSVRVLDNFSTGKRENLAPFGNKIELIEGDLRSLHAVREAVAGVDMVLHQAALPSVPRSVKDPLTSNEVNTVGTLNLLEAAKEAGVKRIVYASSSSVYGNSPELPKREDMTPNPLSPYAVSKLAVEKYCQVYTKLYGIETIGLRYFNVFGPRQDPTSQYSAVIPKFITAMIRDESPVIFGDGEQSRDFTFIQNIVDANLCAAAASGPTGYVVNCACHGQISLNQLVKEINRLLGKTIRPQYAAARAGDIKHSFAEIQLIEKLLNFRPATLFQKGLEKTVEYYRLHQ